MRQKISQGDVLEVLVSRISDLRSELERTEEALFAIQGKSTKSKSYTNGSASKVHNIRQDRATIKKIDTPLVYDPKLPWDHKILFVLSQLKTAFKDDIVENILSYEPNLNPSLLQNSIGVKLSILLKNGLIKGDRIGRKFKYQL